MMPPEDKRHSSETLHSDVLGNLPENLLDDILTRLPLRDTVRTSILSKRWRYNWCRLPVLMIDRELLETTNNLITPVNRFTDIIYHLLTLHVGPITKFTLSVTSLGNCPKIDNLIYFLSRNGIQHLVLELSRDNPYKLPSSFFTNMQMSHLSLRHCIVHPPPAFRGFIKLVCLELQEFTISSQVLESLISCSPFLEQLVLKYSNTSEHFLINAPKLRSFDFSGCLRSISFKDAPLLSSLSLVDVVGNKNSGKCGMEKYFATLEHLHLNFNSVQFLAAGAGDLASKLSPPLKCLKFLLLTDICLEESVELFFALCLIRSSPCLQDIQIKIDSDVLFDDLLEPVSGDVVNEIPASFTGVVLNHLRSVKLDGFAGEKTEMQVIKVLLDKSPMLERMLIEPKQGEYTETKLKLLAEITKFERKSPKVQVVCNLGNSL